MRSWSDHFLPAELRDDADVLRRGRLTVQLSTVLVVTALAYAGFYLAIGFRVGAITLGLGAGVATVTLAALRVRARLRAAGHVLTCVVHGVLVGMMWHEGGVHSLITPWLITPPIFAILLFGRRGAVGYTTLSVLTITAFQIAESRGLRLAVGYPAAWAPSITFGSDAGLVICTAVLLFVFEDVRAAAQARAETATAELARLAYHDALTGLANRARFRDCLDGALARAHAAGDAARVAVLLLDLDGFKGVNDSLGHAAGDALLVHVAARLLDATRGRDTVARLGGDEFAVLLDGVRDDAEAAVVAERIVAALEAPFVLDGGSARVGASIGVARAAPAPGDGPAATAVLHDADVAMYRAKALGRGRWVRHEPGPRAA